MAGVFKPITAKSITQHTAHKEYDLTFTFADKTASFDGVNAYFHSATSRNLSEGRFQDYPATDAVSSNGTSYIDVDDVETLLLDQDIYNSVRSRYIAPEFIPTFKGMRWSSVASMSVFSIPKEHYGERIKPGTVEITLDGAAESFTDGLGHGQLVGTNTVQSESHVYYHVNVPFLENKLASEMPFDWTRNTDGADISLIEAKGFNLNFISARHDSTWTSHYRGASTKNTQAVEFSQSLASGTDGLWKKSIRPRPQDTSIIWLDRMPRTAFYHTDNFQGFTVHIYGRIDTDLSPDSSGEMTIFQLGPSIGARSAPMRIYWEGSKLKIAFSDRTPIETAAGYANSDTFSIAVSVKSDGTVHVNGHDHTSGTNYGISDIVLTDQELRSLSVYNPEHRYGCIGASFRLQNPAAGTYDAQQLDPGPGSARYDVKFSDRFGGQILDFKLYNAGLSDAENEKLAYYPHDQMLGNVYYDDGIIVLNGLDENAVWNSGDATVGFRNTVYRTEYEYLCQIQETEFNMSQNQSILQSGSTQDNPVVASFVSSSGWDPYISTIGLYNDKHELLAVGKLGRPIRKVEDYDLSFVVRFDV